MHSSIIKCSGASVQKLRSGLGISQEELAERADLHRTYIVVLERGARNPTLLTIKILSKGLGVSAADLLSEASHVEKRAPKETTRGRLKVDGILVQLVKTDNPLQLINKAAPERCGSAEDNVMRDPASGKVSDLKFLELRFR
jgi:transcriptional regulator with XRE-family HTH domain